MKYVFQSLLVMLALGVLAGCDVAADVRIGGDPVNGGGGSLDPENDFNIVAYFYTDRPVTNLRYICSKSGALPISGKTDINGSFVCPRDRRVSFLVGEPNGLKLGDVDLEIYGKRAPVADDGSDNGEADARENVTITPSTLYGSVADYDTNEVANIFQLLRLLDTSSGSSAQDIIEISDAVHTMLASAPGLGSGIDLSLNPDTFVTSYANQSSPSANLILSGATAAGINLRTGGVALNPPSTYLKPLVNKALLASRAGFYRYAPPIQGYYPEPPATTQDFFTGSLGMLMGRNGQTTGIGYSWVIKSGGTTFETMTLNSGAGILADGALSDVVFSSAVNDDFSVSGRFVNDRLLADSRLLDPSDAANYKIPYTYAFNGNDVGSFIQGLVEDTLTVYRQFESLPDVDLDLLDGAGALPREFGLVYLDYPDGSQATDAQRSDSEYGDDGSEKFLRFRMLPNGDIVSVASGYECTNVVDDGNGRYRRDDSTPESLIGQIGGVFVENSKVYTTFMLAIFDPAMGEHFGFQLGTPALDGVALDPVVVDNAGLLFNKFCDPALADCDRYLEWFNSDVFYAVVEPIIETGGSLPGTNTDQEVLRKPDYFGRVLDFIEFTCP